MANNRLYLKCKRTGAQVLVAKYYPSSGWGVKDPDTLGQRLNEMFNGDDGIGHDPDAIARIGMWDNGAHELVYEMEGAAD